MPYQDFQQFTNDPSSERSFTAISDEFEIVYNQGEMSEQRDYSDFLTQMLLGQGMTIQKQKPEYYEKYSAYAALLKFKAFVASQQKDQEDLIQRRILFAIQKGYDPSDLIRQFFDYYDSLEFIQTLFRTLAKNLEQNIETLGTIPLDIEGRKVIPQVKYWLLDYSKFPSITAKRTSVERLNYINKSPNARQLTQTQRQQLLSVLKLYDELLNPERPAKNRPSEGRETQQTVPQVPAAPPRQPAPPVRTASVPTPATPPRFQQIDQKLEDLRKRVIK